MYITNGSICKIIPNNEKRCLSLLITSARFGSIAGIDSFVVFLFLFFCYFCVLRFYVTFLYIFAFFRSWNGFHDEQAWAALWLYRATGKSTYLVDAKERLSSNPDYTELTSFYWDDKRAGVILMLAQITRE